jgi:hypothetical protein
MQCVFSLNMVYINAVTNEICMIRQVQFSPVDDDSLYVKWNVSNAFPLRSTVCTVLHDHYVSLLVAKWRGFIKCLGRPQASYGDRTFSRFYMVSARKQLGVVQSCLHNGYFLLCTIKIIFTNYHCCVVNWLTDWLIDWLTDWLTDWPTDRPTDRLTDRPTN